MPHIEGIIKVSHKGIGYVSPLGSTDREENIEIDPSFINTALSGDKVEVLLHPEIEGELRTGEVVRIIERKKLEFVGVLEQANGFFYLVPDDKRVYKDILITPEKMNGAVAGQKVLAKIIDWTDPKKDPRGEVAIVIGQPGEHETEMQAIVYESGFQPSLPGEVEKEAEEIKKNAAADLQNEVAKSGLPAGRRDMRQIFTFTIDPADAKDFDDALSYQKLANDKIEVGIHIADVSHYLIPGTALDKEAVKRATSIYLVDRTIPMLPEILSNDLCSLNPGADKLAFSAIFTFDKNYNIVDEWFGRTVIHSAQRFTYEGAQEVLSGGQTLSTDSQGLTSASISDALLTLNKIAYKLRADKMAAGAIAFETTEIKFVLDVAGKPIKVIKKERTDSNLLVEDFMLLANRKVAEYVSKLVKDASGHFVYRIHDQPNIDKLKQLAAFISPLGYKLKFSDDDAVSSQSINELLRAVDGKPEETMVQTTTMRSMAKAIYSMKNVGHYGLAFPHYTHFTSPIRRYPDVMVHRLLAYYLEGKQPPQDVLDRYNDLSLHSSQMELSAQEAERDSIRYKQIEYLSDRVGTVFDGVISGLAKWGIYIQEQETLAEGMARLAEMKDDYYVFDEKNYCMIGKNSAKRYRLGDKVRVKLVRADVKERLLDFVFV